jgi:glucoamylase
MLTDLFRPLRYGSRHSSFVGPADKPQTYLPQNGSISEQFNRSTGESTSASKLTWSFASFVTMAQRRSGQYPPSWGAASDLANSNVTQCEASSYNATGTFTPARAAGVPAVDKSCKSEMIFSVLAPTQFGQNIYILGNTTLLGNSLDNESAVILPLNTGNITADAPYWFVDIWLPAGQSFEYQYVLQDSSSNQTWTFENVTRTVRNTQCGSGQVVLTEDTPSLPGLG